MHEVVTVPVRPLPQTGSIRQRARQAFSPDHLHDYDPVVEDLMVRHARMRGHAALFLPGLDHASIAAQFVLDGILAKEGESRQSLGRERYLERMRAFSAGAVGASAALLGAAALLAAYIPARRSLTVEPTRALRAE